MPLVYVGPAFRPSRPFSPRRALGAKFYARVESESMEVVWPVRLVNGLIHHRPDKGLLREKPRMLGSKQGPGNSEPVEELRVSGEVPAAVRGTDAPRPVEPGPAAKNVTTAVARRPSLSLARRPNIALVPAILDPLPDKSVHVVQIESICPELADGRRLPTVPSAAATVAVCLVATYVIASRVVRRRPGAGDVLPFRLRQQTVKLIRLAAQP